MLKCDRLAVWRKVNVASQYDRFGFVNSTNSTNKRSGRVIRFRYVRPAYFCLLRCDEKKSQTRKRKRQRWCWHRSCYLYVPQQSFRAWKCTNETCFQVCIRALSFFVVVAYMNCLGVSPPGVPSRVLHQSVGSSSQATKLSLCFFAKTPG